ncbi:hypothetical protein ACJJTC_010751 [Scirpophaga incertulas]
MFHIKLFDVIVLFELYSPQQRQETLAYVPYVPTIITLYMRYTTQKLFHILELLSLPNPFVAIALCYVIPIDYSHVPEIQNIADAITVPPFKRTIKIHQITWSISEPNILHARRLSCIVCAANTKCSHFEIGLIPVQSIQQLPGTLSSPTSEASMHSPVAPSHGTASASTDTGSGIPVPFMETPSSDLTLNIRQPLTPKKRIYLDLNSDDSVSETPEQTLRSVNLVDTDGKNSPPRRCKLRLGIFNDSDDENSPPKKPRKRLTFFDDSDENIF